MKITEVKTFLLRVPIKHPITDAYFTHKSRNHILVRVTLDNGLQGWGEAGQYFAISAIPVVIEEGLKPLLIGMDPLEVGRLWDEMYKASFLYGRKGIAVIAISAVEIAIWDVVSKLLDAPLNRLLGGQYRRRVPAYASGGFYKPDAELVKEMKKFVDRGFKTVKMKVGFQADKDVARVKLVRKEIGEDISLIIDANMGYHPRLAKQVADELFDQDLLWFEEPVSADDVDGMTEVKKSSRIPVAAGENEYTTHGFSRLISQRAIDIVQADATRCGGISQSRLIAQDAQRNGLLYAPHVFGSLVGMAASLHLLSSSQNGYFLEYDQTEDQLREQVIEEVFPIGARSEVEVPDHPGFELDLSERIIEKYRIPI